MSQTKTLESKFKKLEILFCYAEFYSNSKNLEVPSVPNTLKFNQIQKDINNLRKDLID
jgi:hypothetical protein